MTSAIEMFARLNELRTANDMKPLKHAPSRAKMQEAIDKLAPVNYSTRADLARIAGMNPKTFRAKMRRHAAELTGISDTDAIIAVIKRDHRRKES